MISMFWLYIGLSIAGAIGGLLLYTSTKVRLWLSFFGMLMTAVSLATIVILVIVKLAGGQL